MGILSMASFGVLDFLTATIASKIGSFRSTFWLSLFSFVVLAVLSVFLSGYHGISAFDILLLVSAGLLSVIAWLSFTKGFESGKISVIATIGNTWGAITAILGFILLGEKVSAIQAAEIGMIIAGTVIISIKPSEILARRGKPAAGSLYAVVASIGFGSALFIVAFVSRSIGWFPTALFLSASTLFFVTAYGKSSNLKMRIDSKLLPLLAVMGVVSMAGLLFYTIGVTYNYSAIIAPVSSASPLVTILLAALLRGENVSKSQAAGIVMVLLGIMALSA